MPHDPRLACRTRADDLSIVDLAMLFVLPCFIASMLVEPDSVQVFLRTLRGAQGPTEAKEGLTMILLLGEFFWIRDK